MKTAVDSTVLLDVLAADARYGQASREALRRAYDAGALVACEVVWAEVHGAFGDDARFEAALAGLGVEFLATSREAAALAGAAWSRYQRRTRERGGRVLADFVVAAHAQLQADALLARDRGFFAAFKGLRLVQP
ncbi:MAG: PIN domain-containing protein [Betaproteobacteria bacterium]